MILEFDTLLKCSFSVRWKFGHYKFSKSVIFQWASFKENLLQLFHRHVYVFFCRCRSSFASYATISIRTAKFFPFDFIVVCVSRTPYTLCTSLRPPQRRIECQLNIRAQFERTIQFKLLVVVIHNSWHNPLICCCCHHRHYCRCCFTHYQTFQLSIFNRICSFLDGA